MSHKDALLLHSPAKVNFYLHIQGKRSDGYHELIMDLIPISLYDELSIFKSKKQGIEFSSSMPDLHPQDNLVSRAALALEKATGQSLSVRFELIKNIPAGAGLGGGSGNAAAALVGLNRLFELGLDQEQLAKIGLSLGADVPFFIDPKPSLATGLGEKLTHLPELPPCPMLVIYPNLVSPTALAYRHCRISGRTAALTTYDSTELSKITPEGNDFWPYLQSLDPVFNRLAKAFSQTRPIGFSLSGSGSAMFALYPDETTRNQAFERLAKDGSWQCFSCHSLQTHSF